MSIVACLSLLSGIVLGLRFNVRLLLLTCLSVVVLGVAAGIVGPVTLATGTMVAGIAVLALQVGYFVAVVITAMQLTDEPQPSLARKSAPAELGRGAVDTRRR
ncbi:hypothetical protein EYW49_02445 [Siculibacillus lacustris]|uniref:Uncharacterized protein n=1 Tax=Siculibacillus lacustris TaxID=1549641 RepID=A0A4Q9VXB5_9HYPH|nr:hypothetical protein [Siculibacillus lacustris]TBW41033.1 hypothetical protein EYW49_02445 [Siculibacillus lacustris]